MADILLAAIYLLVLLVVAWLCEKWGVLVVMVGLLVLTVVL